MVFVRISSGGDMSQGFYVRIPIVKANIFCNFAFRPHLDQYDELT